jgi:hypothetical protein
VILNQIFLQEKCWKTFITCHFNDNFSHPNSVTMSSTTPKPSPADAVYTQRALAIPEAFNQAGNYLEYLKVAWPY